MLKWPQKMIMFKILEKHRSLRFILLLFILLAVIFFMPSVAAALSIAALILSFVMAILFIVRRQLQAYRAKNVSRAGMFRNIVVEIIGLLLTIMLAALIVRSVAETMNLSSGWTAIAIAIALSILIGMVIGWLVKVTWGRLAAVKGE